jgi:hypothetical protein
MKTKCAARELFRAVLQPEYARSISSTTALVKELL